MTEGYYSVTRLGWCISGHHIGKPSGPQTSRCPGKAWQIICQCNCHTDPAAIAAEKLLPPSYVPPVSDRLSVPYPQAPRAAAPEPPAAPKPTRKRQKRKLL